MQVSRDSFARETLHRETEIAYCGKTCDWCGNVRMTRANRPRPFLYEYSVEPDSIHGGRNTIKGLFCSISCMRAYHGGR